MTEQKVERQQLIPFQEELLAQILLQPRGFWVVGSGLGLEKVLQALVIEIATRQQKEHTNEKELTSVAKLITNYTSQNPNLPFWSKPLHLFLNVDVNRSLFGAVNDGQAQQKNKYYKVINSEITSDQRKGGVVLVTSRIFVVDLIKGRVPWNSLAGIYLAMPSWYMISEDSAEAFIFRLYAENVSLMKSGKNPSTDPGSNSSTTDNNNSPKMVPFDGYSMESFEQSSVPDDFSSKLHIKAFSDNPSHFLHGFGKLRQVCNALKVGTSVYFWPRFRKSISSNLDGKSLNTVIIDPQLCPIQRKIHDSLISLFWACLKRLQDKCSANYQGKANLNSILSNTGSDNNESSSAEPTFSYEKVLFGKFYSTINAILEPLGRRVPSEVRSMISELNSIRKVITCLIHEDAVTFYNVLQSLRRQLVQGEADNSSKKIAEIPKWLLYEESVNLFDYAQERMYTIRTNKKKNKSLLPKPTPTTNSMDEIYIALGRKQAQANASNSAVNQDISITSEDVLTDSNENDENPEVSLILEDNPKWRATIDVLNEIASYYHPNRPKYESSIGELENRHIIIIVKDVQTRNSLMEYLSYSQPNLYLLSKVKEHLLSKISQSMAVSHASTTFGSSSGVVNQGNAKKQPNWFDFKKKSGSLSSSPHNPTNSSPSSMLDSPNKDVPSEPLPIQLQHPQKNPISIYDTLLTLVEQTEIMEISKNLSSSKNPSKEPINLEEEEGEQNASKTEEEPVRIVGIRQEYLDNQHLPPVIVLPIHNLLDKSSSSAYGSIMTVMEQAKPHFVLLYDADPCVIRLCECFKASLPGWYLRLYMLLHKNSMEEEKYLASVKIEVDVFKSLIEAKSKLPAEDDDTILQMDISQPKSAPHSSSTVGGANDRIGGLSGIALANFQAGLPSSSPALGISGKVFTTTNLNAISAQMQVTQHQQNKNIVIVDMREFRSKLPGMLHAHRIKIVPETLVIADYILTPDIAVERKSLADLKQSFQSGRLHNQMLNLCRLYKIPILLIEFDSSQSFRLHSGDGGSIFDNDSNLPATGSSPIYANSLSSRLVALSQEFPRMRIAWSSSPNETARLFVNLKMNQPQPNSMIIVQSHSHLSPSLSSHNDESSHLNDDGMPDLQETQNFNSMDGNAHIRQLGSKRRRKGKSNDQDSINSVYRHGKWTEVVEPSTFLKPLVYRPIGGKTPSKNPPAEGDLPLANESDNDTSVHFEATSKLSILSDEEESLHPSQKLMKKGSNSSSSGVVELTAEDSLAKFESFDMFKALPGISEMNWRKIVYGNPKGSSPEKNTFNVPSINSSPEREKSSSMDDSEKRNNLEGNKSPSQQSNSGTSTPHSNSPPKPFLESRSMDDDYSDLISGPIDYSKDDSGTDLPGLISPEVPFAGVSTMAGIAALERSVFLQQLGYGIGAPLYRFLHYNHFDVDLNASNFKPPSSSTTLKATTAAKKTANRGKRKSPFSSKK